MADQGLPASKVSMVVHSGSNGPLDVPMYFREALTESWCAASGNCGLAIEM